MEAPRIDENSPYFIHPSENPSLVLLTPALTPTNYHSWSRNMRMALIGKNKLEFVDGTIRKPAERDPMFPAWRRCNNLILSWFVRSASPTIGQGILGQDSAKIAWDNLKEKFSQGDAFRIANLQGEIYTYTQGTRSVTEYFTGLHNLWDEYIELKAMPTCVCQGCVCNALNIIMHKLESDFVITSPQSLLLTDSFSTVKSQIMITSPLPSSNRVFSLVLHHERQFMGVDQTVAHDLIVMRLTNPQKAH